MEMEMTAPTAAAAIATIIVERRNRPRMMVSFCLQLKLLQRIIFNAHKIRGVVFCRRVRTSTLRKGEFLRARSSHQPREAIVSFKATRLVVKSVLLVALPGELLLDDPWLCPHRRIFDGHDVFERSWPGARPALDQMQVLTRALKIGLRAEVCHVDDERIVLPVAPRVAIPLADVSGQVRPPVHDDVALPPLTLTHVIKDRDAARCLHNPAEATGRRSK